MWRQMGGGSRMDRQGQGERGVGEEEWDDGAYSARAKQVGLVEGHSTRWGWGCVAGWPMRVREDDGQVCMVERRARRSASVIGEKRSDSASDAAGEMATWGRARLRWRDVVIEMG